MVLAKKFFHKKFFGTKIFGLCRNFYPKFFFWGENLGRVQSPTKKILGTELKFIYFIFYILKYEIFLNGMYPWKIINFLLWYKCVIPRVPLKSKEISYGIIKSNDLLIWYYYHFHIKLNFNIPTKFYNLKQLNFHTTT